MLKEGLQALRSGHWPSLLGAWLHFEVSFMVWLLIGALSIAISEEFALSASEKGVLVGIPLLGGSLLRVVIGPLGDWAGAKVVGLVILGLEAVALTEGLERARVAEPVTAIGEVVADDYVTSAHDLDQHAAQELVRGQTRELTAERLDDADVDSER